MRAEINSSRFGRALIKALDREGLDHLIVARPDTADPAANAARRRILGCYRGYPRGGVFTNLPDDTVWQWVALSCDELVRVRYLNWKYWVECTGGTRLPVDAIGRIGDDPVLRDLVATIACGRLAPEIIVVGRPPDRDLVVLEGHMRLTAMVMATAMAASALPPEIRVLLGTSPHMNK